MGAYQYFQDKRDERRQKREKYLQKVKEEGRREERERIQNQVDSLREKGASDAKVIRTVETVCSSSKDHFCQSHWVSAQRRFC